RTPSAGVVLEGGQVMTRHSMFAIAAALAAAPAAAWAGGPTLAPTPVLAGPQSAAAALEARFTMDGVSTQVAPVADLQGLATVGYNSTVQVGRIDGHMPLLPTIPA